MANDTSRSIIDDLGIAYRTEIAGHAFYNSASELIEDERGKNLFKHLALEELEHIKVIYTIANSIKQGAGWMSYERALKESTVGKGGLPIFPKENELFERLKKNQTDLHAVQIGMESEEKAVEFYTKLLKQATGVEERMLFTKLLDMERNHLKLLRWESEALTKTGFWCDIMEYSVEKEMD